MTKIQSPFKFDHREMTVIFSLFIFTSLLMFTIGIVVGKSLAQPKTNEVAVTEPESPEHTTPDKEHHASAAHSEGTSVSTEHQASKTDHDKPSRLESLTEEVSTSEEPAKKETAANHAANHELELIPEKSKTGDVRASLAELVDHGELNKALKNPKIQNMIEEGPKSHTAAKKRGIASIPTKTPAKSFPEGKYTVQVGSYPSQADASLRVEQLRKLGYPFAYLSTKELGDKKEPWYRVWLGYFPDSETAKASGDLLQERGEVKSYLVRKTDTKED